MWAVVLAGGVMGLISSLHCIGMCGPLVMSLPLASQAGIGRLRAVVVYNAGRITTYAVLGGLFGLAGRRLQLAGWQQWLSIVSGVLILVWFIGARLKRPVMLGGLGFIQRGITQFNVYLWKRAGKAGFYLLGMGNGLLPCGMVYLAVAAALTTGHTGMSMLFMISFGVGTLPAMTGVGYFPVWFKPSFRVYCRKLVPVFTAAVGIVLILRGLNLDIPFISPRLPVIPGGGVSCH
jgi:hypothetical protein